MADIAQTNAQVIAQITALIQKWNEREAQIKDWLGGAADGGPNNDGRFPLSPYNGTASLIPSPAALADLVAGPAAQAENSAELAGDHAGGAAASKEAAETARDVADAHRASAASARDLSLSYQNQTEWYWSQAMNYHGQIVGYRDTVLTKHGEVLSAHAETLTARDDTLVAKAATLAARDQTLAYVAQINPALLATKAELANELAALVGSSQATLNTLQEIGAALGNDPNFATTITTQLAGKAPATHTHTTSQIAGLDTALAGKAALSHTHGISDIIGLQGALDAKLNLTGGTLTGRLTGNGGGTGNSVIGNGTGGLGEIEVRGNGNGAAMMTFHRPGSFAAYIGLDTDNFWKVGGWSMGGVSYKLYHEGAKPAKSDVGLGNVDNTSDASKPVSTSQQTALNAKLDKSGGTITGALGLNGQLYVNNTSPTIYFQDSDHYSAMLHCNDNTFYVLRGGVNSATWSSVGSRWPMAINLANNDISLGGSLDVLNNLIVNASNATGGGIVLADDGDIVDLNDGYCAMRFSNGVRIYSGNRSGIPTITLNSTGSASFGGGITASEIYTNNWLRVNSGGGVYWEAYGRGIHSPDTASNAYGNVATYGSGRGGWAGFAIHNWATFMRSASNSDYGLYNNTAGDWGLRIQHDYQAFFNNRVYDAGNVLARRDTEAVGWNQKWYQETWAANTSYQNTNGRPIQVSIQHSLTGSLFQVSDNGTSWVTIGTGEYYGRYQVIVPSGHYWRVTGSASIIYAATLR